MCTWVTIAAPSWLVEPSARFALSSSMKGRTCRRNWQAVGKLNCKLRWLWRRWRSCPEGVPLSLPSRTLHWRAPQLERCRHSWIWEFTPRKHWCWRLCHHGVYCRQGRPSGAWPHHWAALITVHHLLGFAPILDFFLWAQVAMAAFASILTALWLPEPGTGSAIATAMQLGAFWRKNMSCPICTFSAHHESTKPCLIVCIIFI